MLLPQKRRPATDPVHLGAQIRHNRARRDGAANAAGLEILLSGRQLL